MYLAFCCSSYRTLALLLYFRTLLWLVITMCGFILVSCLAMFGFCLYCLVLFDVAKGGENLRELGLEIN